MALHDASQLQETAVRATLDALNLTGADQAAKLLAVKYAQLLDTSAQDPRLNAWALRWIGPQLLDTLEALGATPRARGKTQRRDDDAASDLDELRQSWSA